MKSSIRKQLLISRATTILILKETFDDEYRSISFLDSLIFATTAVCSRTRGINGVFPPPERITILFNHERETDPSNFDFRLSQIKFGMEIKKEVGTQARRTRYEEQLLLNHPVTRRNLTADLWSD